MERRWSEDNRGVGIGSAAAYSGDIERLLATMRADGWVAEAPEVYLLPNLVQSLADDGLPFELLATEIDGVFFTVKLRWQRSGADRRRLVADVFGLLGAVAEVSSFVHQDVDNADSIDFSVVTGMLDGDGAFKGHGHVLRLSVTGDAVERLLRNSREPKQV